MQPSYRRNKTESSLLRLPIPLQDCSLLAYSIICATLTEITLTHKDLAYCNQLPVGVISWGIISYSEAPLSLEKALHGLRHTSFAYTTLHRLTTTTSNFTWTLGMQRDAGDIRRFGGSD